MILALKKIINGSELASGQNGQSLTVLMVVNPFPVVVCFLNTCLICSIVAFIANNMNPDQTAPLREQSDQG